MKESTHEQTQTQAEAQTLTQKTCKPCEGGVPPLKQDQIQSFLKNIPGWQIDDKIDDHDKRTNYITREFKFKNYYHVMAFVNAIAWIAHHENHHPDLEVGYDRCFVRYTTHAIGGLSENDFICAAKVNELFGNK